MNCPVYLTSVSVDKIFLLIFQLFIEIAWIIFLLDDILWFSCEILFLHH